MIGYTTRIPLTVFQHALSPSMLYFTLPMELKQWDLSGLTGLSQWSDSVVNFYVASKAAAILSPTSIPTLQLSHNLIKSKTDIMPTTNWRSSLKRKRTPESLLLMNVSVLFHAQPFSCVLIVSDRSHIGPVLPMPEKSHHSRGPSRENHQYIGYSLQHNLNYYQTSFLSSKC